MKLKYTVAILIIFWGETLFGQYAKNSAALSNIDLVNNPNPETSIQFKSFGSGDEIPWVGDFGVTETVSEIMVREKTIR